MGEAYLSSPVERVGFHLFNVEAFERDALTCSAFPSHVRMAGFSHGSAQPRRNSGAMSSMVRASATRERDERRVVVRALSVRRSQRSVGPGAVPWR